MDFLYNITFAVADANVSLLEVISTLCGLLCVFLAGRASVANFWVGYAYNILLFMLFWNKNLYASMLLQPVSLFINAMGHWRWTHPASDEANSQKQLKVTLMKWRQRGGLLLAIVAAVALWGFVLSNLDAWWPGVFPAARSPYLDATVAVMILCAQFLSAQKRLECWIVWLTVDIAQIILYLTSGLVFMPAVSAIYLVLAAMGLAQWRKQLKTQDNVADK